MILRYIIIYYDILLVFFLQYEKKYLKNKICENLHSRGKIALHMILHIADVLISRGTMYLAVVALESKYWVFGKKETLPKSKFQIDKLLPSNKFLKRFH